MVGDWWCRVSAGLACAVGPRLWCACRGRVLWETTRNGVCRWSVGARGVWTGNEGVVA